ncbi:hypothetical protein [Streptomyces virginiae]|uniref:hypothetical protein n=1 Tax=Streptomyces virginiae TaxID=1961 RepID=UPI0022553536|nr:hypothetical protein [Streptomyces virginiae]MCX5176692.1 hypothetical protein [Streptomyces virginiae]
MSNPFQRKGGSMPAFVPDGDSIPAVLSPGGPLDITLVFHGGPMDGSGLTARRPVPRTVEVDHDTDAAMTYTYELVEPAEDDGHFHYAMTDWRPRDAA